MLSLLAIGALLQAGPAAGRKLIWSDEFNEPGLPNASKWGYETGKVRNHEAQYYTEGRRANARVEDGNLVIEARKEAWEGSTVTSASLTTKESWTYGYFEVRAKFPTGKGTWPAIWFLGDGIRTHKTRGWPFCGEIDLMENVGWMPDKVHFTVHTGAADDKGEASKGTAIEDPVCWQGFHVYGLDWKRDRLDMYYDGKLAFTYTADPGNKNSWPFDKPSYMLLNLAIGGDWGGKDGIDDAIFPAKYLIDYVRVYR